MSPAGSTSMPRSVPSTTVSEGLAASEEAMPAVGAVAIWIQLIPLFGEEKICLFWVSEPLSATEVQATSSSLAFTAPSSACDGWPSGWGSPTVHEETSAPARGQAALPSVSPVVAGPTGVQSLPEAGEDSSVKLVHPAANACPPPVQDANSANARLPTVSRSVTRSPWVSTCVQVCPPVWVTHSSGPNAHPSLELRNLTWLTPVAPSAAPVIGAGAPAQVRPALSVRAIEVQ